MPIDYEITDRVDEYFATNREEEPELLAVMPRPVSDKVMAIVLRYERKLGRKLKADEGQVLVHEALVSDPNNVPPRFMKCDICGGWIDNGPLHQREWMAAGYCDFCTIPF